MYSKGEKYNMSPVKKVFGIGYKNRPAGICTCPGKTAKKPANPTTTTP
jgi:hypothetical protein